MEWQLTDERKKQYDSMVSSAKELEANIGSAQVRIYKLIKMRDEIDTSIKTWWEKVLTEMNLDPKADYMINNDGFIKDVSRAKTPEPPAIVPEVVESKVGTNANDLV